MKPFSLDQLRALSDVAELGSFSAAAARRNLSQPAVSLQVRQLEKRLGVRLVERIGRRAAPTAAGMELLAHAARINGEVEAALEAMSRHADGTMGRVRLGTGATALIFLLPPLLRRLRERFPALEITVTTGNTPEIVRAVEENALDIALVTLPAAGRMLEVEPVMREELLLAAPAGTALPPELTASAVAGLPLILFAPASSKRRLLDGWFAEGGAELSALMSLDSVEAIKELVGAGLGCAVLPAAALGGVGRKADFVTRRLVPPLYRELAIVVRRDKVLHRGLKELASALRGLSA